MVNATARVIPAPSILVFWATHTAWQDGNLKDDAILYKYADDDYVIMPSDIDHSPYFLSLCQRFELDDVTFTECTDSWAGIAVQGPLSALVLQNMGFDGIESLEPFAVRDYELAGGTLRISRLGFTADLGYECWFEPSLVDVFTDRLKSARSALGLAIPGYGLSALQACRLEGGFIVAGWDCATEVEPQPGFERSPYELSLGWLVNLDAAEFVGRNALREQKNSGHRFTLRSFELEENSPPDDGVSIFSSPDDGAAAIGIVNCSGWSWGLEKTIGNASIESKHIDFEDVWIQVDGSRRKAKLSRGPLVTLERRNQLPAPTSA